MTALNGGNRGDPGEEVSRQDLRPVLDAISEWAQETANRPPQFWDRQRTSILSRVAPAAQHHPPIARPAWITAATVVILAGFILASGSRVKPSSETQTQSDRELLLKVERAMQNGGPDALEPAAFLANEISEYQKPSSPTRKEVSDEE